MRYITLGNEATPLPAETILSWHDADFWKKPIRDRRGLDFLKPTGALLAMVSPLKRVSNGIVTCTYPISVPGDARSDHTHEGIDLVTSPFIKDIGIVWPNRFLGRVAYVGRNQGTAGNFCEIEIIENSIKSTDQNILGRLKFMHLSAFDNSIKVGAFLTQGQLIGWMGDTGFQGTNIPNHLHFETWKDDEHYDAKWALFMQPQGTPYWMQISAEHGIRYDVYLYSWSAFWRHCLDKGRLLEPDWEENYNPSDNMSRLEHLRPAIDKLYGEQVKLPCSERLAYLLAKYIITITNSNLSVKGQIILAWSIHSMIEIATDDLINESRKGYYALINFLIAFWGDRLPLTDNLYQHYVSRIIQFSQIISSRINSINNVNAYQWFYPLSMPLTCPILEPTGKVIETEQVEIIPKEEDFFSAFVKNREKQAKKIIQSKEKVIFQTDKTPDGKEIDRREIEQSEKDRLAVVGPKIPGSEVWGQNENLLNQTYPKDNIRTRDNQGDFPVTRKTTEKSIPTEHRPEKSRTGWIVAGVLAAGLATGGFFYFKKYYRGKK